MLLSNVQIYDYLQIINEQNYIGIRNSDIHKTLKRSIYYFFNSLDHKFPDDHSCTEVLVYILYIAIIDIINGTSNHTSKELKTYCVLYQTRFPFIN